jgi:hypothetical protein
MFVWTLVVLLLVLWAVGLVASYTFGGLIHALLVAAVGLAFTRWIGRRRGG